MSSEVVLEAARVAAFITWVVTAIVLTPAWVRTIFGKTHYSNDPFMTGYFYVSIIMVSGIGRWFVAPTDTFFYSAIYVLTLLLSLYIFRVRYVFGRGRINARQHPD